MRKNAYGLPGGGPTLLAVDPWLPGNPGHGRSHPLLSEEERKRLASISTLIRVKSGERIYEVHEPAEALFTLEAGVIKTHRPGPDGGSHITAFLFHGDLIGLAEEGRYTDTATAVTNATLYRIPVRKFRRQFSNDALFEFNLVSKLLHDLRLAQRHAFMVGSRSAERRVAIFLQMLEQLQFARSEDVFEIYLPMARVDIADYLSLSPSSLSRAFRRLQHQKIIKIRGIRHVIIQDREIFERLVDESPSDDRLLA